MYVISQVMTLCVAAQLNNLLNSKKDFICLVLLMGELLINILLHNILLHNILLINILLHNIL